MSEWHIATLGWGADGETRIDADRELTDVEHASTRDSLLVLDEVLDRVLWRVLKHSYANCQALGHQIVETLNRKDMPTRKARDAGMTLAVSAIMSFLTAMHMYLDQTERDLKHRDRDDNGKRFDVWRSVCSAEYDDHFAYRFLYRFRNYVLHRGLPIGNSAVTKTAASPELPTESDPPIIRVFLGESPQNLIEQYKGWSTVKSDLASLTTPIDLVEQIEIAMECLARVEQAYIETLRRELRNAADALKQVLGDPDNYDGVPLLIRVPEGVEASTLKLDINEIDVDRVRAAMQLTT
ncbi:MAG: hypothetical protein OXG57_00730 [Acidimicrobiaceae bacterium]|nr:hypothetical protein [Acidimicrobiaceae bacterium]